MCPLGRLLPPSGGARRQQDHQGIWNTNAGITEMLQGSSSWCPCSCSPPCCPFARVSVKECLLQLCRACDQRCLLGPFVFSSWDLMAWMLFKIFFWWPIMVMPRLRTSLQNKTLSKTPVPLPRETPAPLGQPRSPCLFSTCPAQGWSSHGPMDILPGTERMSFPWACPADKAPVTAWAAAAASFLTGW